MRDRLSDMIQNAVGGCAKYWADVIADKLLSEGVIVPPVKVGQRVFFTYHIDLECIVKIVKHRKGNICDFAFECENGVVFRDIDIGNFIFLTREEAEKALERSEKCSSQ